MNYTEVPLGVYRHPQEFHYGSLAGDIPVHLGSELEILHNWDAYVNDEDFRGDENIPSVEVTVEDGSFTLMFYYKEVWIDRW